MTETALVWFRNDLRVQDNTSLYKAMSENQKVIAVYFFNPKDFEIGIYGFKNTERYRAQFLLETITELKDNLEKLNVTLFVYNQYPEDIIPKLIEEYAIRSVYLQKEWTDREFKVLKGVKKAIQKHPIHWVETYDQFLLHPDDIPFDITDIPKVFTNFRKKCEEDFLIKPMLSVVPLSIQNTVSNTTSIPSISDLGYQDFEIDSRTAFPFKGGEQRALDRVNTYFWDTKLLSNYKKTRNGLIGIAYSSKLSSWLANGSISARTIFYKIKKYEQEIGKNDSTYWLIFELIWRDFFKYIALKHENEIFKIGGILQKNYEWKTDQKLIDQWINGETSEPFVNANMIELKNTGWISNRGRQNVASYFTKELELDWRIGAAYFQSLLIDFDVHSNYGNWLYVAGVGNDPRDRKFNIKLQSERYDPEQSFQNLWLKPSLD